MILDEPKQFNTYLRQLKAFLVKWKKSPQISQTNYAFADFCAEQIKGKGLCGVFRYVYFFGE